MKRMFSFSWLVFFVCGLVIVGLLVIALRKKRIRVLLPALLLGAFFAYSFFTVEGSVRLAIALMGHPVRACTTALQAAPEGFGLAAAGATYLKPVEDIPCASGSMLYFQCRAYGVLKISDYYGF